MYFRFQGFPSEIDSTYSHRWLGLRPAKTQCSSSLAAMLRWIPF
jgi:hypothetical protein